VYDPLAAGRRLATRAVVWQVTAAALLALAFLAKDGAHALAALLGGGAMALGSFIAARLLFRGGVGTAGSVMGRWFAGMALKWVVVFVVLWLGLVVWRMPPLPLLAGIVAALVALALAATRR
jgi:F0F1-type ATP synthase assembly protein I